MYLLLRILLCCYVGFFFSWFICFSWIIFERLLFSFHLINGKIFISCLPSSEQNVRKNTSRVVGYLTSKDAGVENVESSFFFFLCVHIIPVLAPHFTSLRKFALVHLRSTRGLFSHISELSWCLQGKLIPFIGLSILLLKCWGFMRIQAFLNPANSQWEVTLLPGLWPFCSNCAAWRYFGPPHDHCSSVSHGPSLSPRLNPRLLGFHQLSWWRSTPSGSTSKLSYTS